MGAGSGFGANLGTGSIPIVYNELDPVISYINPPPGGPTLGDRYLINSAPSGAWVGHATEVAEWDGGAWVYTVPATDDIIFVTATLSTYRFNGSTWVVYTGTALLQGGNSLGTDVLVGARNNKHLRFVTNNLTRGSVRATGEFVMGGSIPHASAIGDFQSTTKGFKFPSMTTAQKNAIATPATGLTVFDTDLGVHNYYDGASWVGFGGSGGGIVDITYADLLTLYNAGTMTPGFYKITDKADDGIIVEAVTASRLSLSATGLYLVPDFQFNGNYSGVLGLTGQAYVDGANIVWNATDEAGFPFANGDVVFQGGLHWQVTDSGLFTGTPPDGTNGYTVLPKATANVGYILEADFILYDFINDVVKKRFDKRNNEIDGFSIDFFQWGNDTCAHNIAIGTISNLNTTSVEFHGNYVGRGITFAATYTLGTGTHKCNHNTINFVATSAYGSSATVTIDDAASECSGCVIDTDRSMDFTNTTTDPTSGIYQAKMASNFVESITITGLTTIDLGVFKDYVGIMGLSSTNATESINLFANFVEGVPVRFNPEVGLTVTFVHGTGANQPRCNGATNKVINGSNGDTIEFVKRADGFIYQANGNTF